MAEGWNKVQIGDQLKQILRKIDATGIPDYQKQALKYFSSQKSFKDTRVLEIGGHDLPDDLKFNILGAKKWFCIDLFNGSPGEIPSDESRQEVAKWNAHPLSDLAPAALEERDLTIEGDARKLPDWFAGQFDLVVSISTFDQILSFPILLEKVHTALYKGGGLLAYFGPIWSGPVGHKLWIDAAVNFNSRNPIGNWEHLLLGQSEFYRKLCDSGVDMWRAAAECDRIYSSGRLNRLFYEDYAAYLQASPFSGFDLSPSGVVPLPAPTRDMLRQRYPRMARFDAYGIRLNAWKLK